MASSDPPLFRTTRWSLVLDATATNTSSAPQALEELCQLYWIPAYAVVRRSGHNTEDACDIVQGFFAKMLEKDWLRTADPARGQFRTFFLTMLRRYMINEWHLKNTLRRGSAHTHIQLDTELGERLYQSDREHHLTPDAQFDRRWAIALLDTALQSVRAHYIHTHREAEFRTLQPCLTAARGEINYQKLATALRISPGATRVAVHRLRKTYRNHFREQIARTLGSEDPQAIDAEMHELLNAL